VITKYLKGVDLLNKGISFTPSLSTIMLLDLQIQELTNFDSISKFDYA